MIQSFKEKATKERFESGKHRNRAAIATVAKRKLDQIEASLNLNDLRVPPGSHLEALEGDRKGQHSIKINDQYRICLIWKNDGAHDVEVVDYH